MSSRALTAASFFGPLRGKTSTFVVAGRQANLALAQTVASLLALTGDSSAILDIDALYSSNADSIFGSLPVDAARSTLIHIPQPGSSIEGALPRLFSTDSEVLVIDSLNSLYHLLAQADGSTRSRKLSFAITSLSYLARTDGRAVIFTMYRRERLTRSGGARPISGLSDLTASVELNGSELTLKCERGSAWPGGRFSIRIP